MDPEIFFRFDDHDSDFKVRPRDAAGNLDDLDAEPTYTLPAIVDGIVGNARRFPLTTGCLITGRDLVPGSTLMQRDCTVRAVISIDALQQNSTGAPGALIVRGRGDSAAEYQAFGIEFRVVNIAQRVLEVRWFWQDAAGVLKTQVGAHFVADGRWTIITCTRRWISSTSVLLRHYVGDTLIGETISSDGSIGGGTTGQLAIGYARVAGAWTKPIIADIDEIQVYNRELTVEEISATWDRITYQQPRGYQLLMELHDPGFPLPSSQGSDVLKESRMWGYGLGFAMAQAENVRDNILPDAAYGDILTRWERVAKAVPKASDDIDTRRRRVVANLAARAGASLTGLADILAEFVATNTTNLAYLAFDNTIARSFLASVAFVDEEWLFTTGATWTATATGERIQPGAGTYAFDGASLFNWWTAEYSIPANNPDNEGRECCAALQWSITTLASQGECGVYLKNGITNSYLMIGIRNNAGTYQIVSQRIVAGVADPVVVQASLGAVAPASVWLRIRQGKPSTIGSFFLDHTVEWSTTSAIAGFTTAIVTMPVTGARFQWAGAYWRTIFGGGATVGASSLFLAAWGLYAPYGDRTFELYVYRDPALAGTPDTTGAHNALQIIRQAHTEYEFISSKSTLCDTDGSYCDRTPLGGI